MTSPTASDKVPVQTQPISEKILDLWKTNYLLLGWGKCITTWFQCVILACVEVKSGMKAAKKRKYWPKLIFTAITGRFVNSRFQPRAQAEKACV